MIRLALRLALRGLVRRRRRAALVWLTIVLGVAVATVQRGLVEGVRERMIDHVVVSRFGHVRIAPAGTAPAHLIADPRAVERVVRAAVPDARVVARLSTLGMAFAEGTGTARIAIHAADPPPDSAPAVPGSVLLGRAVAERLAVEAGDPVTLSVAGPDGRIDAMEFTVDGVLPDGAPWESYFVHVALTDLQSLLGVGDAVQAVDLVLPQGDGAARPTADRLRPLLPGHDVATFRQTGTLYLGIVTASRIQAGFIEIVLLFAVGLAVAGAQLLETHERRREFGTMIALGTSRSVIRVMVLAEGALLALVGGAAGAAVGAAATWILGDVGVSVAAEAFRWMVGSERLVPSLDVAGIAWTVAALGALVLVCGLHPASRAARLPPAEALRRGAA